MKKLFNSFKYAWAGISYTLKNELNFVIQLIIFLLVVFAGLLFKINKIEWIIILLVSAFIFSLELLNTALEILVDLTTKEYNEFAKKAKDAAAGAVLVMAFFSILIGITIFYPYILNFFK